MAMAPEQSAPAGAPAEQASGGGSQNVGKLIDSIHSGLAELMQVFSKTPDVPDEFKQKLDALGQGFTALIQEMSQGPAEQPQEASGQVPMEAGANKNVQQAM